MRRKQIGIIGASQENIPAQARERLCAVAQEIGRRVARRGFILFTGGTDGLMECASKGASLEKGIIVGTPGRARGASNTYVTVEVCTPMDTGDFLFAGVLSCDAIIVLPGGPGTVAEAMMAYRNKKRLICLEEFKAEVPWLIPIGSGVEYAKTIDECMDLLGKD